MEKKRKSYRKIKNQQKFILLLITCVLIIAAIFLGSKLAKKRVNNLQTNPKVENQEGTSSNSLKEQEDKNNSNNEDNKDKVDTPKLDNSGYLSYEEDPNADDGIMVAENTKGLLNGTKHYPVRTDGKKVAYLTFDDGPSTTNTPKILDILDKYNIKATFFVLGSSIDANEGAKDILKEEVKRGHAIANHTYGHDYSYLYPGRVMNVKNILSDLEKSQNAMKAVLGKDFSTRVIRFPGGYWSWEGRTAMKEALEQNQYYNVDWNALNKDAEGAKKNADQLVQCAKESVKALGPDADSVVLLMHDTYGKEETVKALPQIIEYLQSQGFEFRSIK